MKNYKILTEYGVISELATRFEVSTKSIRKALAYISRSDKAAEIRETALREYHGQVIEINDKE